MNRIYNNKPWLKGYPSGVSEVVDIPLKSLNDAFDEATERWKKKTALVFYGKKMSFGTLREKVDRFANALSSLGIKKGDMVAFLLLNSPAHVIAFYGVLKVGAILSPISPVYVSIEIEHQLKDSGAETLISEDILYGSIEKLNIEFKNIILSEITDFLPAARRAFGKNPVRAAYQKMEADASDIQSGKGIYRMRDLLKEYSPDPPQIKINPKEDLATLPYTGGTTGSPKGVMITHYNLLAVSIQYAHFYPVLKDGEERTVAYMPYYHAAGQVTALVMAILHGYSQVIISNPDIDDILFAITRYKITAFNGVPSMFESLKDYKKSRRVSWSKMKLIGCGADALHENTSREWKERTGTEIHEIYGMTETCGITHTNPGGSSKIGSMGIPMPNTMAAILDPDRDEFLSPGEIGEVVVNGPQVTSGYWQSPGATKECEAHINGVKWWRTGDLGRMEEDGFFYIYDRKRDLIKYKGLRIFAREVEEALKTHPSIKDVGVIGVPDVKVGEKVKAMVVLESDARGRLSEEDIREYCKDKLASYKIPKIVEFVGEVAKTDVGKVSRKEMREMHPG